MSPLLRCCNADVSYTTRALDLLFKFFTSWCFRIVPALFLRDMYRAPIVPPFHTPPKTPHYSPMLHNALVALGTAFLDDPNLRDFKSRRCFVDAAKHYLEVECQKPQLSVVHALDFLAGFHASQGDQTLGFLYFGQSPSHSLETLFFDKGCVIGMSARMSQAC